VAGEGAHPRLTAILADGVIDHTEEVDDVAHCRTGDQGNTSILSLIAYRPEDYPLLVDHVTVAAVAKHLREI